MSEKPKNNFDKASADEAFNRQSAYVRLREAGCKFFPLRPNSKLPACKWQDEQTDKILQGNVGVAIPPGMVVIDIDNKEALERVRTIDGWVEDTFTIKTPRGRHFYWATSGKYKFTQFAGNNPILGKNVDLRVGGDGYLVGPYSEIAERKYRVLTNTKIKQLPAELEDILYKRDIAKIVSTESGGKNFSVSEGGRDNMLTRIVGFLFNTHGSEEEIRRALGKFNDDYCDPPMLDSDIDRIWKSIGSKRPAGDYEGVFVECGTTAGETLAACLAAMNIQMRYNLRSYQPEVEWGGSWAPIDDLVEAQLYTDVGRKCISEPTIENNNGRIGGMAPIKIKGQTEWNRAINYVAGLNPIDPFEDLYLDTIKPKADPDLLDGWMEQLLPLEDDPHNIALARWASRYLFLGIVQRTKEPGCKLDEILTLHGEQGIGKSALCSSIIPPDFRGQSFTDRLVLTSSQREAAESLQGIVLAEASEMTGMSRADIEKVKSVITTTQDYVRLAYRKNAETIYRRCIIVGTSNTDCLPNDPTGNRRFVVVKTKGDRAYHRIESWMDKHRDRLFAAALWEYKEGNRANLPRDLLDYQKKANDAYRITDDLVEDACLGAVEIFDKIHSTGQWLDAIGEPYDDSVKVLDVDGGYIVALRDICIVIAHLINRNSHLPMATHLMQHRVKQALVQTGWEYVRRRTGGRLRRAWQPPRPEAELESPSPTPMQTEYPADEVPF